MGLIGKTPARRKIHRTLRALWVAAGVGFTLWLVLNLRATGFPDSVLAGDPDRRWVVAGHSRGGALAAEFTYRHSEAVDGLVLIGTSHPKELDLSGFEGPVTKISGSEDGLASPREIREFASNLPAHATFIEIEGANHAQFGWYGTQLGDGDATISREEQTERVVEGVMQSH